MASVFLAFDTVLNRQVALKMVHPHLLHQPETMKRFATEAHAIASLSHENIIKIYDYGESDSQPFIVMEYIEGATLEDLISRHGIIPNLVTVEIAFQILSGLISAHKEGIYHRDIKPGNILIDGEGCLHITDFGIAYLVNSESITITGSFIGSPHYISPEQVSNRKFKSNTDIFSLGVVLYQCLTGTVPFDAATPHGVIHAIINGEPACPGMQNSAILDFLVDMIDLCLIKNPEQRPDAVMLNDLLNQACQKESLQTGKKRLSAFIQNPHDYSELEKIFLFKHYSSSGEDALHSGKPVSGLRYLNQASRFGELSQSHRDLIKKTTRPSLLFRYAVAAIMTIIIVSTVIMFLLKTTEDITSSPEKSPDRLRNKTSLKTEEPVEKLHDIIDTPADAADSSKTDNPDTSCDASVNIQPPLLQGDKKNNEESGYTSIGTAASTDNYPTESTPASVLHKIGFFKCFTNPPWVTLFINGIQTGRTPTLSIVPLPAGNHIVHLTKKGFLPVTDTVMIHPADTTLLRKRLIPIQQGRTIQ